MSLSGSLWLPLTHSGPLWLAVRLSLALSGSLSGSLWLSLALSGSLRLSLALYCSPNLLTKPLLGSQGPCSARNAVPEFPHFNQPWLFKSQTLLIFTQGLEGRDIPHFTFLLPIGRNQKMSTPHLFFEFFQLSLVWLTCQPEEREAEFFRIYETFDSARDLMPPYLGRWLLHYGR